MDDVLKSLSPAERKVFPVLKKETDHGRIADALNMDPVEVMRALQWLSNKKLISIEKSEADLILLDKNGMEYRKSGLPEMRLLRAIDGDMPVEKAMKKAGISKQEINISVGALKKKGLITIRKDSGLILCMTSAGKKAAGKKNLEEKFLENDFPLKIADLLPEQKFVYDELKKRKLIIRTEKKTIRTIRLTKKGEKLLSGWKDDLNLHERLTPDMLKSGRWKDAEFRHYDVSINVPKIHGGKRHFVNQAIDYAKRIWLDMGFEEMTGNLVDTSFWVFDALFTAQDHPVREMQDTFFVEDPEFGKLPDKKIVSDVKSAHETGVDGSLGWKYSWKEEEAKRNVLRTHTTVLSARTLAALRGLKDKKKGKYFCVGRNFRNETVDWSHLFEFNQTDGIVIDPDANFRNLLWYLREFFKKMGYPDARFRPAFFSYTEPSVEIDVFHPHHKKWVEFGGAGMFRPEVVIPLIGYDVPVLAWGPGFDRIYLDYYDITDIRDLYKNDIKQLREAKMWMR